MKQFWSRLVDRCFIKQPRLRRAVTRLLEGDKDKQVEVVGTTLTINTLKEHGYLRASRFCNRSSLLRDEVVVLINLAFLLSDEDTFVDIGANVGVYTHTVARFKRLCPGLRIYAFEANPDTFRRLTADAAPDIKAEQIAIAAQPGRLDFVAGAVSHVFTTTAKAGKYSLPGDPAVSIQACPLDDWPLEGDSLVLKVDVEGQEKDVLTGATRLFEAGRVKAVYLDGYEERCVEDMLKGHGFELFDGRTMQPTSGGGFSLLAVHESWLRGRIKRWK